MNDEFLKSRLQSVARRYRWLGLWRKLAACWAIAALVAVVLVWMQSGLGLLSPLTLPILLGVAAAAALVLVVLSFLQKTDYRWIARKVENKHPELNGVLLTAVQQQTADLKDQGYLQYRVLQEATARSQEQDWSDVVPGRRLLIGQLVHLVALACFVIAALSLRVAPIHGEAAKWVSTDGISITPGDTKIEKGDSLVVLARFGGALPSNVTMVIQENGATARSVPLVKSLADPVFGGSVAEVQSDLTYHLEYRGKKSREFKVTVYEHPRLVRSDVDLKFPDYTKLAPKHIEDTRRVSAVEGTKLDFALQLNKPVKSAKLVARDKGKTAIPLAVSAGKAVATLAVQLGRAGPLGPPDETGKKNGAPGGPALPVIERSQSYDLQLVDDEGRANKVASPFVIDVQPNRPPEIRLASPRGDVRPSALEEVNFDGTLWDDFGISAFGLAYSIGGDEPKFLELGKDANAKEKKPFNHMLKLEDLGAKPDDLVSWYVWADDIGPDGKTRRTNGDLYFGEIRPFDEIFREAQNMESGDDDGGGQGNEARKLTELQKQIINATWKLQRTGRTPKYVEDEKVVADAQQQALAQAEEAAEEARSPRHQALWKSATQQMEKALEKLKDAATDPAPLGAALSAEQAAYQGLLRLQARETQVTRRNRNQRGGGGGNQRQIEQLDLQQAENRYETQRQAKAPQNKERREQLAVMNRLQELARRQQDLNERLKELQTALQEAQTEKEKEEIKRRLKRLEEEQRRMLADADELKQRMDRAENQSNLAQQRQQLEQTREELQKAAEATAEGSVAQALASGTRAQRQLQEMRDDLRKQNSSQFADDLREMRSEARELANKQDEIGQKLDSLARGGEQQQRKSLGDSGDRKDLQDQLDGQKERMNKLLDRAQQISEQAENTEPLLSRQLYDSIRKVSQDDANAVKEMKNELMSGRSWNNSLMDRLQRTAEKDERGKALDLTGEMLREGYLPQARQAGQRARSEIDELRRGVERAAESVLGDDAEQLKLAQSELDSLTDQVKRELAQATGSGEQKGEQQAQPGKGQRPGQPQPGQGEREQQAQAGEQGQGQQQGEQGQGQQPGQRGDRSQRLAGNDSPQQQRQQQGQGGQQPGQQPGQGKGEQNAQAQAGGQQGGGGNNDRQSGQRGGRDQVADARQLRRLQQGGNNERGGFSIDDVMNIGVDRGGGIGGWEGGVWNRGPLTGEEFRLWEQRLRDVEDLIETPELRNALAAARERARIFRRDMKSDLKKPDWTVVQLEIIKPLVEVRNRVAEELARRDNRESLAPIDRDPVPNRFAESVRRYYEELGKDGREAEGPNPKAPAPQSRN